jgi:hypothetical protein
MSETTSRSGTPRNSRRLKGRNHHVPALALGMKSAAGFAEPGTEAEEGDADNE